MALVNNLKLLETYSPKEIYELVLNGTIKKFPNGMWSQPDSILYANEILIYLIEDKLKLKTNEEILGVYDTQFFKNNKLMGMLQHVYEHSPYKALNSIYEGRFKEWDLTKVPIKFWTPEKVVEALKYVIEEKMQFSDEEIKEKVDTNFFIENDMYGMLKKFFNNSPFAAINYIYPGRFKEWEMKFAPNNFWNKENCIKATKWLVEEKFKMSKSQVLNSVCYKFFEENNLGSMLRVRYNGSPIQAIMEAYPGEYHEWEFKCVPNKYWNKNTVLKVLKWILEEKYNFTDEQIIQNYSYKFLLKNNIAKPTALVYKDIYTALDNLYPGKFKKSDFKAKLLDKM